MMKNRKTVFAASAFALLVLLAGGYWLYAGASADASGPSGDNPSKSPKTETVMYASWGESYFSIEELTDAADLAALVEITGIAEVQEHKNKLYLTIYSAKVIRGIDTDLEKVKIIMTGKDDEEGKIEFEDDPLMAVGDKWFIFARRNDDGTHTILGGPDGRFSYDEETDTVTALRYQLELREGLMHPGPEVENVSLDDIERQVTAYQAEKEGAGENG